MSDDSKRDAEKPEAEPKAAELESKPAPNAEPEVVKVATAPTDSADAGRRRVLHLAAAGAIAGGAGLATWLLHDSEFPIRRRAETERKIADRRLRWPKTSPQLVIARGPDPAKNARAAIERLGGIKLFVQRGDVVLVKPNIGWDRTPEQAADTNPQVVGEIVRLCKEAGARKVWVTDCPVNNAERSFARSGITAAVRAAGGEIILPEKSRYVLVRIPGALGRWPVLEPYITATKIINVPVAKHHSLTRATVGMKNWYGILGGQRNRLHQRIDVSVAELAALMLPTLTVVDATRVLLRNGPTGGSLADVKRVDAVLASIDPVAADAWAVEILGADPREMRWLQLGQAKGLGVIDYKGLAPIELSTKG